MPGSPGSSSVVSSHGKSTVHDGSMPVFRCFEAPGSFPVLGAGLFSPGVWLVELAVAGPLK